MAQLSRFLRSTEIGPAHWCPGCKEMHLFYVNKPTAKGAQWTWDGNVEKPTFNPSMNISCGPWSDGTTDRCHYFLRAGLIQFLSDSTHALAGQTVPLPQLPAEHTD